MSAPNDGGPAFPQPAVNNEGRIDYADHMGYGGMTLRDWFAGQALAGLLANPNADDNTLADTVEHSFRCGDAMLLARERRPKRDAEARLADAVRALDEVQCLARERGEANPILSQIRVRVERAINAAHAVEEVQP